MLAVTDYENENVGLVLSMDFQIHYFSSMFKREVIIVT